MKRKNEAGDEKSSDNSTLVRIFSYTSSHSTFNKFYLKHGVKDAVKKKAKFQNGTVKLGNKKGKALSAPKTVESNEKDKKSKQEEPVSS